MFTWITENLTPLGLYDNEHRTVYMVRLAVHFTGCAMIFTGTASHSFLAINRRLMVVSLMLVSACMLMEETYVHYPSPILKITKLFTFKVVEACITSLVLLGCFLLRSITLRETYRLNNIFTLALVLDFSVLATDNAIKLGYLGNSIIAAVAYYILREFLLALQAGGGGDTPDAQNVRALMHLQGVLTLINMATFGVSFHFNAFGLKLSAYVLQIFAVTLFYLFVRPYLESASGKAGDGGIQLLLTTA